MTAPDLLDSLLRTGAIRAVDHALGHALRRNAPDTHPLVVAGAALASHAVSAGHAAFDPARPHVAHDDVDWPAPEAWHAAWAQDTRWCARGDGDAASQSLPLVYEHGLLYLRRYREYERALAVGLRRIAGQAPAQADVAALCDVLFPPGSDPHQRAAAEAALAHALLLVTGGPGTGKTTTIARVLALLVAQAFAQGRAAPRIALAAPTGRAAERMAASLRRAVDALRAQGDVEAAVLDALPQDARTLHRLLGPIPDSARFRHDADDPLAADIVVVDEASMVDLPLMAKLADAIGPGTRLLLLGDADQLPSVEAGDVLAAMVQGARGAAGVLPHVRLARAWRQHGGFDLAPLAHALREGDADAAVSLLRGGTLHGVEYIEDGLDPLAPPLGDRVLAPWRALREATDPAAALAAADTLRVLCAVREGPQGTRALNARIEQALAGPRPAPYFAGRLLLVTANSPRQGLSNGDVGVCLPRQSHPREDGDVLAWFATSTGLRAFHPATLPAHESAYATTVHKAQGSEFDTVVLQLPARDVRVASRELLYTAATRARGGLVVCAGEAVLRAALARHVHRVSGLARRLACTPA